MNVDLAVQIGGGVAVGGTILVWFAKMMASRLIRQYDEKLSEHDDRLSALSEKFAEHLTDLKVKLAKLEPLVLSAIGLRDDLKSVENTVAVLKHVSSKTNTDLNHAYAQIKSMKEKLETLETL